MCKFKEITLEELAEEFGIKANVFIESFNHDEVKCMANEFKRLGYSNKESLELAYSSLIYSKGDEL